MTSERPPRPLTLPALAIERLIHHDRVVLLEGERFGDADAPRTVLEIPFAIDLLQRRFDRSVIGGEVDRRTGRNGVEGNMVGGIEPVDEARGGREHVPRSHRRDAATIDHHGDHPAGGCRVRAEAGRLSRLSRHRSGGRTPK